jgi:hypothetical protein
MNTGDQVVTLFRMRQGSFIVLVYQVYKVTGSGWRWFF